MMTEYGPWIFRLDCCYAVAGHVVVKVYLDVFGAVNLEVTLEEPYHGSYQP